MPVNGYTVGRDLVVTMAGPGGTQIVIDSDQVVHFDAKPQMRKDWARPLNSPPQPLYIPDGWQGTVEVDRATDPDGPLLARTRMHAYFQETHCDKQT